MKKQNNKGFTLIELLLALTILSIFMVMVNAFITTMSKTTKKTRKQLNVQSESEAVYNTIYDALAQSTGLVLATDKKDPNATTSVTPATTTSASATTEEAENNRIIKAGKTTNFDAKLSLPGTIVHFVSKSALSSMVYAKQKYSATGVTGLKGDYTDNVYIGRPAKYGFDSLGTIIPKNNFMSYAQYMVDIGALEGKITDCAVFDPDNYYQVRGLASGPVKLSDGTTTCNTIVYEPSSKNIYLNRGTSPLDFTVDPNNIIAENCKEFYAKVNRNQGSVELKITLSDGGHSYTYGGTINLRNKDVLK